MTCFALLRSGTLIQGSFLGLLILEQGLIHLFEFLLRFSEFREKYSSQKILISVIKNLCQHLKGIRAEISKISGNLLVMGRSLY